ncbi:hypothetical protein [Hymenobacter ruricola]|uniref:Uncharacterized protein n=1 Tax=Hymenobacter ruricola TaxID=2791023 RepID=A0ABS0I824_9BACT|nr:hypothetical protein [Hymenobacter ruricola]MBF9223111.1 hypothetical protein [Hymenobacter ruricola]
MNQRLLILLGIGLILLLPSCVVYMPIQCAAPQITDKKQGEVTLSTYLNGRADIAGTYSPVRHLLVRAAFSNLRDNSKDSTYYRGHQYDLGLGTYWQPHPRLLVGALGGFGQAQSMAGFSRAGFFFPSTRYEYDARYNKVYGEAYGTFQASNAVSLGLAYRVTQVNFTTLTNRGTPVDLRGMTRGEPMVYFRVRLGDGPPESRPVQLQAAWGSSSTFGYYENATYAEGVRDLKQTRGYTTIGITLFPHCLFGKAASAPEGR